MWSAFIMRLKLPEICMKSRLINCPLIPSLSGYDFSQIYFISNKKNILTIWDEEYFNDGNCNFSIVLFLFNPQSRAEFFRLASYFQEIVFDWWSL